MFSGTFWSIGSFLIVSLIALVGLLRWAWPKCKRWRTNRAYALCFYGGLNGTTPSKCKAVALGEHDIPIRVTLRDNRYIYTLRFYFVKKGFKGHTSPSVIEGRAIKCCVGNEPLWVNSGSGGNFVSPRLLKKQDTLDFTIGIVAKLPWSGRLEFEFQDENGVSALVNLPFEVIESAT